MSRSKSIVVISCVDSVSLGTASRTLILERYVMLSCVFADWNTQMFIANQKRNLICGWKIFY